MTNPHIEAMMETVTSGRGPGRGTMPNILLVAVLVIGASLFLKWTGGRFFFPEPIKPYPVPAIRVEGWLNGPGPSMDELKGKVVVLDAWAWWCAPCRMMAPEMVKLAHVFRDQGVVFIGLTQENASTIERSKQFLQETGVDWPNGYGASETLNALQADTIPRLWVINRKGLVIWDESSTEDLEKAIRRAIEEKVANEK